SGTILPATATFCDGSSQMLTATGGTSYQWYKDGTSIPNATTNTFNAKVGGTYTVDITTNGCTAKASNNAVVTVTPLPSGTISPATATICAGASIVLTASGGTSYQWYKDGVLIGGENKATYTVTNPGKYAADIKNGNCTNRASNEAVISAGSNPVASINPAAGTICKGGSLLLSATPGFSYQWQLNGQNVTGATGATYKATLPGTYRVLVSNGTCTAPSTYVSTITEVSPPSGTITPSTGVICSGGSISLTVTGGTSYQWYKDGSLINGAMGNTYIATEAGIYSADIISNSCNVKASNTSVITFGAAPSGAITPASASICSGGSVTFTTTGGTSYQWYKDGAAISGANKATLIATLAGIYSVDIINGNCKGKASNEAILKETTPPVGSISPAVATICPGGSQVLTATGGGSYQWARNGALITDATSASFTATQEGIYSVLINNGTCSADASNTSTISQNATPVGTISPGALDICSGSIGELTATGGSTYQWYRNGISIMGAISGTLSTDLGGTYTADILDKKGCIGKSSNAVVISVVPLPSGNISPASLTICSGGSATLTATGGTSYQWYKDGVAISGATTNVFAATQAGTYTADIIKDKCKSKASNAAIVVIGSKPVGDITPSAATLCNGGSVAITVSGGSSYQWYRDGLAISGAITSIYTATLSGTYTADIFSGTCKGSASNAAVVTTGTALTGTISPATISICNGSSASLSVNGGTTYQWYKDGVAIAGASSDTYTATTAGVYTADIFAGTCKGKASNTAVVALGAEPSGTITPAVASVCAGTSVALSVTGGASYLWYKDGALISGATASNYTATQTGIYTADIISNTGCKAKASNAATISVNPIPTGSISPASVAICPGGAATVTATGGTNYQWYKNGTAISGATQNTYSITTEGTYSADIINGVCKSKSQNEVMATVTSAITGAITPAAGAICPGGNVVLTATGGTSYQWYRDGAAISGANTATYSATTIGTYTADISNGTCNGKTANSAVISNATPPTGTITPASATFCMGGGVLLTANGGSSYQWLLNGAAITGATEATYTAKQPGTYTVSIFNKGCSGTAGNGAIISASPVLTFETDVADANCASPTGTITIQNAKGGSGTGYVFSRDNGISFQLDNLFKNLSPGTYKIVMKDAGGCTSNPVSVDIKQTGSSLAGSATTTDISCSQNMGSALITTTGGVAPYTISLDGGTFSTANNFNNLKAGPHMAAVKDAAGCTIAINFSIIEIKSTLTATAKSEDAGCGQPKGSITVNPGGGQPDYQYNLDGGAFQPTNSFTAVSVGTHKVIVKDKLGCTVEIVIDIKQSGSTPKLVVTNPPNICAGTTTDLKAASITDGSESGLTLSYYTDAGATIPVAKPEEVKGGTYFIKGTLPSGCFTIKPVVVTANLISSGTISPGAPPNMCIGDTITLTATPGSTYQWYRNEVIINGATTQNYKVTESGTYGLFINNGTCTGRASNPVVVRFQDCIPVAIQNVFVPTGFTPNGNGVNDGLRPILYHITTLKYFRIFNRWGQVVFQTNVKGKGWDGTINGIAQPEETYTWILECVGADGAVIKKSGRSLLIR
ncbi:MAG: gliding motility-associated C-terminal domain-containing protein, partial [Chitinophagaceae bacterium]